MPHSKGRFFETNHIFKGDKMKNLMRKLKHNQFGRTMTEMLGVLAIIGVLSIGGFAGYRMAITKYKANETINELSKRATVIGMEILQGRTDNFMDEFESVTGLGYPASAYLLEEPRYFEIQLEDVPANVCEQILNSGWTAPILIMVNGYDFIGKSDICVQNDDNIPAIMTFQFAADLNENELPYGMCRTDTDCAGNCIKCENNRCVSTCSGDEKCAQQISTGEMMCCPKNLREGPYCCNVKNNGMCCNAHNQCCPYYKPLIDRNGNCFTCDYASSLDVTGVTDNCNVCTERELVGNKCMMKCPADKPLRSSYGECFSCETPSPVNVVWVSDNCQVCPNRTLTPNKQNCAHKCGTGISFDKPIMDKNGTCHSCDEENVWQMDGVTENCGLCSTRTLIGTMCAPKTCPDGQFMGLNGTCYSCDITQPVNVNGSPELCAACPEKTLGGAWNSFCIDPCGSGRNQDKPLMDNGGICHACDDKNPINLGGVSASVCAVCDNTDTPREVSNGFCVLKNICADNQIKDVNGNCRDCDDINPIHTTSSSICRGCSNRVPQGAENRYCSLPCDEGIYEGKPLVDSTGNCHSCEEKADIRVFGVEINCLVCDNRISTGNYCVLNE